MKMKRLLMGILSPMILVACAQTVAPYAPMNLTGGLSTGYLDREIDPITYEIQVRGNAVTTYATLEVYFHRRATELCGSSHYKSEISEEKNTVITDGRGNSYSGFYIYTPTSITSFPYVTGTVICEPEE